MKMKLSGVKRGLTHMSAGSPSFEYQSVSAREEKKKKGSLKRLDWVMGWAVDIRII
jgi:hypothetical protein